MSTPTNIQTELQFHYDVVGQRISQPERSEVYECQVYRKLLGLTGLPINLLIFMYRVGHWFLIFQVNELFNFLFGFAFSLSVPNFLFLRLTTDGASSYKP